MRSERVVKVCRFCGREGVQQFERVSGMLDDPMWVCKARSACLIRSWKAERQAVMG